MALHRLVRRLIAVTALGPLAVIAISCATAEVPGGEETTGGNAKQVCLLHGCSADSQCAGCTLGRGRCLVAERRCVACDSETESGCTVGEICSEFGQCIPEGLECPTDDHGQPVIACTENSECAACDPQHRICDPSQGLCVGCTADDTSECPSGTVCEEGACSPRCPKVCEVDGDCSGCGAPGAEAHACNAHKCAECSATFPCAEGQTCTPTGICVSVCGTDGKGTCEAEGDCSGCGGGATLCHSEAASPGTCGPDAANCKELVSGGAALPEPWGAAVAECSSDASCKDVRAELNIGKVIREMTGIADVRDATVRYGLGVCGSIVVGGSSPVACGVCVPCVKDADCADVDVEPISEEAFGPAGSPEAAYLLDQVFGSNDRVVQMYCDPVGGGYGVCAACPGLVYDCGVGGGGVGSGTCDHDACMTGSPLDGSCDECAALVCDADDFCCTTSWDAQCVSEAGVYCDKMCNEPVGCVHMECETGEKLDPMCSTCAEAVCAADSYCCDTKWDETCVSEVEMHCGESCGMDPQTCESPFDCPWPQGCLPDGTCGDCTTDTDCAPDKCDAFYGECY